MNGRLVGVMLVMSLVPRAGLAQIEPSRSSSTREIVLDGAKNPELFPEWFIWEQAFQWLDRGTSDRTLPLHEELGVSESELKVLLNEVRVFKELQRTLAQELVDTRKAAAAQRKNEDEIRDATQAVNLDYRHKVLEGRQRVSEQLSPEGLFGLREWLNVLISGTQIHLRGRAIEFFKQPW